MITKKSSDNEIIKLIKNGGIGVIPTDTVYGLVGLALNKDVVEKIYKTKGRDDHKPLIILIYDVDDIKKFGIKLSQNHKKFISNYWPGKVSIILPSKNNDFEYLSRGTNSLTFRQPNDNNLIKLIQKTGPLVAPSANLQNHKTAGTIKEAKNYFKNNIDFYIDGGEIKGSPSTLIDLTNKKPLILRQGDTKISCKGY